MSDSFYSSFFFLYIFLGRRGGEVFLLFTSKDFDLFQIEKEITFKYRLFGHSFVPNSIEKIIIIIIRNKSCYIVQIKIV